jgi:hypothetical protein
LRTKQGSWCVQQSENTRKYARGRERSCNAHQQKQAQLPTAGAHGEKGARRGRNRDMLSNLIVENERCVGASEGRLGQLREIISNGEHGRAHGARRTSNRLQRHLCGHFGQSSWEGRDLLCDCLKPILFEPLVHVQGRHAVYHAVSLASAPPPPPPHAAAASSPPPPAPRVIACVCV